MSGTPARYFRGQACCDGRAPVWGYLYEINMGAIGGPLSDDETVAILAVANYGGTFKVGHPSQLMPMEHTNLVDWNRPIFMSAANSWGPPFNRDLPRLNCFADLPSLPNPDVGPQNGLPHHQQTLDYQARERAKQVLFTNFRIVYDEMTGRHAAQILWCEGCRAEEDPWGDFVSDLGATFTEMVPVIRGIAMVCSYVPVLGTGVAFLINTATSLAQGQSLDAAFLDGFGLALPGQPMSGTAFTAVRSLVNGDRIDKAAVQTALAALNVDPLVRDAVGTAVEIAIGIARGNTLTNIALEQFRERLPESGKKAMDIARRACAGENVGGILSEETMAAARNAAAQGEDAVNSFIAQAGFECAMGDLPPELQGAVKTGIMVGVIEGKDNQFVGTFGSVAEANAPVNETYLQKGQRLIDSGVKYGGMRLSDIVMGRAFTIAIDVYDALNGVWGKRNIRYKADGPWAADERPLTDAWRRGFTIALGVCQGSSMRGPGQTAVYQTMAEAGGRDGFDAGQAVAWWMTTHDIQHLVFSATETTSGGAASRIQDALAVGQTASATTRHRRHIL
jgi:hypothetical protein